MGFLIRYLNSTIGRKQIMAIAGIGLCLFVLSHAIGNLLLFIGPEAYNKYGHALTSNPLIYVAELGLITIFLLHIVQGIVLTARNRASRTQAYAVQAGGEKSTSLTTRTMIVQGMVILIFVVLHLVTFKFGPNYDVTYEGVVMRDLFRLVVEVFQDPIYVVWYFVSVALLGYHLGHGFYSALQTLGLNHPNYMPKVKAGSVFYGLLVFGLFAAQPIYMFAFYKG